MTLMRKMHVKRACRILVESDSLMRRMLFAYAKAAPVLSSSGNVVCVGADEINRRKGHDNLTVFADLIANRVLSAIPGKDARFGIKLLSNCGGTTAIRRQSSRCPST